MNRDLRLKTRQQQQSFLFSFVSDKIKLMAEKLESKFEVAEWLGQQRNSISCVQVSTASSVAMKAGLGIGRELQ